MNTHTVKTYDVSEVAAICHCLPETVYRYINTGLLRAIKPGRKYCILAQDLDDFFDVFA